MTVTPTLLILRMPQDLTSRAGIDALMLRFESFAGPYAEFTKQRAHAIANRMMEFLDERAAREGATPSSSR